MKKITPIELKNQLDAEKAPFLLDVREMYEREMCSIASFHMPMGEVCQRTQELPTDQEIVVLCQSGKRAEALVNVLEQDFNFARVSFLEGGVTAWFEQFEPAIQS